MATNDDPDTSAPAIRFKRRKLLHPKRAPIPDSDAPSETAVASPPIISSSAEEASARILSEVHDEADGAPNLREILRARKRPQDRMRDAARKAAERKNEQRYQLVLREGSNGDKEGGGEGGNADQYSGRFIAQTGQVVDVDDVQM
jgi:hypothetical protein